MSPAAVEPVSKKAKLDEAADAMDHDSPTAGKENASGPPAIASKGGYAEGNVHDLMPLYYARLFPAKSMMKWLSYGNDGKHPAADAGFMQRREFCFTLEGDIFARYQSFKDEADLRKALRTKVPTKIDLGPVFNVDPQKRAAYSGATGAGSVFTPVEREFVMDIDMTDYDDVRTCCSAANICGKCWPLMTVAVKVIDAGLREDFGFEHLLWVYSGRRGIHCWVCDDRARKMSNESRAAVAEYFGVYTGADASGTVKRVNLTSPLHPSLQRAYADVLDPFWRRKILPDQELLTHEKTKDAILAMIPDAEARSRVESAWKGSDDSVARWEKLEQIVQRAIKADAKNYALRRCLHDIVFAHVYPRLDVEVSKHMNHLLKAPFCVHPKTGRVCVPMDPKTADDFDPMRVPTVNELLNELNAADGKVEATRMQKAVDCFNETFWNALEKECKGDLAAKTRENAATKSASATEW
jgi:DNA primase small subunit